MKRRFLALALLTVLVTSSCESSRRSALYVDSSIQSDLAQISAIDNHAHPQSVVSSGDEARAFDALPADSMQDMALPTAFRAGSPYFQQAWHALFGYNFPDGKPEHLNELEDAKRKEQKQRGDLYPSWS